MVVVESRSKVLITESLPLIEEEKKELNKYADVIVLNSTKEEDIISAIKDVDVLMVVYAKITRNIIKSASKLRGIVRYGIGVDNIDLEAATEEGIVVANVPDYSITTVADFTMALILACARKIIQWNEYVRGLKYLNRWTSPPLELIGVDLENKVLGIIGLGKIGREVAKRAKAFGMKVIAYDPYISLDIAKEIGVILVDLDTLLKESDFVSIHVPLTKETYHMITEEKLKLMKRKACIINTARGAIIDEKALIKALTEEWIACAALDVFEIEPLPQDNPLLKMKNVILTPHVAWFTEEAMRRLEFTAVEEAIRILKGEMPKNVVNKEVLKSERLRLVRKP